MASSPDSVRSTPELFVSMQDGVDNTHSGEEPLLGSQSPLLGGSQQNGTRSNLCTLHFWYKRRLAVLICVLLVMAMVAVAVPLSRRPSHENPTAADNYKAACSVFCHGALLHQVQMVLYANNDSKIFVDRPLLVDPTDALQAFAQLPPLPSVKQLRIFVETHFGQTGSDLVVWFPPDHQKSPPILAKLQAQPEMYQWAKALNDLWLLLGKQASPSVQTHQQRHTLLYTPYPLVVPGGRFRENYYWDSYWVIRGLLLCGMTDTARNTVRNLLSFVRQFGFVPNGGRVYYLDRSQPPYLSEMVLTVYNATKDATFLADAVPLLDQEYAYWMGAQHAYTLPGGQGILNRFNANTSTPRPESYR